mmetsp:Transcript_23441/g.61386  ORF Transcript_23441/g.61386 Transcript_23441/m.61386 type:complete len:489 (-) Transcript_23441:95-1561(-)|eukprot:CAMPEP_0182927052 /NCGR_PEP_ID=MMETSP0105_2-20130417/13029_1 /TAXON_ID=81532 ORGANISM="Acanthoeca-like sp., Strain 10tr" /NCGR_SAMPLE_ID=MMETSP0105_2 /ASSEMBLY_ACC=CAM_ASM_000205 /LENGTH=488 /DNA_ID=CAMNT_0025064979 /DNA_START=32 /DNA_END=1498 /DNA_ORIENTATION=-
MGKDGNIGHDVAARPLRVPPEFGDYAERARVFELIETMTKDLVVNLPADPLAHMISFLRRNPVPRVVVLGPMGSGRRELCDMLATRTGATLLEMGEMVTAAVELESDLGRSIKPYVETGKDIPGDFLEQLVIERVAEGDCVRNGFILWNFPADRKQAMGLQVAGVLPSHVLLIEGATVESAAQKLTGRLLHPLSKRVYHSVLNPPPEAEADLCDPVPSPAADDLAADHKRFDAAVVALRASYGKLVVTVPAALEPSAMVEAVWPALTTRKQTAAPWIPRAVVLGARGSADQEVAAMLAKKYGLVAVHTQDILQQAVSADVPASKTIEKHLTKGGALPDSLLSELVESRLAQLDCQTEGWVLTGYPRTAAQATALEDAKLAPNRVFFLNVDREVAHDRQTHRRTDPATGERYDTKEGAPEGVAALAIDPADTPAAIDRGLAEYSANADDLREVFDGRGVEVDANVPELLSIFHQVDMRLVQPREGAVAC